MLMRIFASLVAVLVLAGVAGASEPLTLTSPEEENKLGEDTYKEILQKEKLCKDTEMVAFVERVAKHITAAAPDKGFKYEVSVLDSPTVNAFCLPGGKICVYTGILPYCQNEAGLATVISHEVAHAILRHGGQRMTQATVVNTIGSGLGKVLEFEGVSQTTGKVALGAYGYGTQLGILLPYSRGHETEADLNGLLYMAKAGYDPHEAPEFWKRFSSLKSSTPTFLSTHPADEDREQRLEKAQPKALKLYEQSPTKLGAGERLPPSYLALPKEAAGPATPSTSAAQSSSAVSKPASQDTAESEAKPKKRQKKDGGGKPVAAVQGIEDLAQNEIKTGLQTALKKGFRSAIAVLGKEDGFLKDALVKIALPEQLTQIGKLAQAAGQGKYADQLVQQMNRAAEKAVPGTADILAEAIGGLTLDDARSILKGSDDAATQYFKRTCRGSLEEKILPVVKEATDSVGVASTYKKLVGKAGLAAKLLVGDFDLDNYVTSKAVDGLFVKIADEEKRIRDNPAGQASDILQKVFGVLKK